jgi:putative DNA primase/helicase
MAYASVSVQPSDGSMRLFKSSIEPLSATISKGYKWPLCDDSAPIGDVILLSAEDDPADTIRPRLDAAGADCSHIFVLEAIQDQDEKGDPTRSIFSLKRDIPILDALLKSSPNCQLLIIDPISSYLDGTDSHNNSDVRGLLAPLADLAVQHKVAIILVHHLNKNSGGNALYRTMGSLAFTAAVRSAYVVTKDKDNPQRRLFMPTKNNLAKDLTGLAYSISANENNQPVITWESQPVTMTADEALSAPDSNEEQTDTDWAVNFLENELANGPVSAAIVMKGTREVRVGEKALRRAREKLGVVTKKIGFNGGWFWSLPNSEDVQVSEGAPPKSEGVLGMEGQLRGGIVKENVPSVIDSVEVSGDDKSISQINP